MVSDFILNIASTVYKNHEKLLLKHLKMLFMGQSYLKLVDIILNHSSSN